MNKTNKRVKAYKYINSNGKEVIVSGYDLKPRKKPKAHLSKHSSNERRTPLNSKKLREAKRRVPQKRQLTKEQMGNKIFLGFFLVMFAMFVPLYVKACIIGGASAKTEAEEVAVVETTAIPEAKVDNSGGKSNVSNKSAVEIEYDEIVAKIHPNCAQYIPIIQKYDWDHRLAAAVMVAENHSCQADNQNRSDLEDHTKWCGRKGSFGLWQLATCWSETFGVSEKDMLNPETNIEIAYKIYKRSGGSFHLWSAYKNGSYERWLAVAVK